MTRAHMIDKFIEYRKKISAWFEDPKREKEVNEKAVTFMHFEEGYKAGYEKRKQDEIEELMDAL